MTIRETNSPAMPLIHPAWAFPTVNMMGGYSLEMTAKDIDALNEAAPSIFPTTPIAVTFLPNEGQKLRVAAVRAVRDLGFEPMPHFSARRIGSLAEFEEYIGAAVAEAGVKRCFVIAGDPATPEGPFTDSSALIATGAFERHGISAIGIGGHPEGHPNMTREQGFAVLETKCAEIVRRGMAPLIVTQFVFDANQLLAWLLELRQRQPDVPVRIGIPGPASIKTLMRFATRCGVGASSAVLAKYGISITRLLGSAGPDKLVDTLDRKLGPEHGPVRLHFYPFGGFDKTVRWINDYDRMHPTRKKRN
jgi:methylenetetrahydrofolate reductase (NADPH)